MRILILFNFLISSGFGLTQITWYVSTAGSDGNSGLLSNDAFATVDKAIGSALCGDSIYVLAGVYHEKINASVFCPENNRLIVQGDLSSRPIFIGDSTVTNRYAIGASGSGFLFRHLELTSPYPDSCSQSNMVVVGSGDYFDFIDIIVHHAGYDGIKTVADCSTGNFPIGWRIIDSEVHSNGLGCPASIVHGDGIDFTSCHDCLIENTTVRDNMGHQIQVKLQASNVTIQNCHIEGINMLQIGLRGNTPQCDTALFNADGVYIRYNTFVAKGDTNEFVFKLSDVSNLCIENNTIVKDSVTVDVGFICFGGCGSAPSWQYGPVAPVIIRNNIFCSFASEPFYAGPDTTFFDPLGIFAAQVTSSYNLFYDSNGQYVTPPDNSPTSFVADPRFCQYPTDFELAENSPCIDEGDPSSLNDPDLSQNDIGARYYSTPCSVELEEAPKSTYFSLFPNPSAGELSIILDEVMQGSSLIIYNNLGQGVCRKELMNGQNTLTINHLADSVYNCVLVGSNGDALQYEKLIIRSID
jgi:hypothetical protein